MDPVLDLSCALLCVTGLDGSCKYLSPSWQALLDPQVAQLVAAPQQTWWHCLHPDDRPLVLQAFEQLRLGKLTVSIEVRHACMGGNYRWFLWCAALQATDYQIHILAQDITDCKQVEFQLHQTLRAYMAQQEVKTSSSLAEVCDRAAVQSDPGDMELAPLYLQQPRSFLNQTQGQPPQDCRCHLNQEHYNLMIDLQQALINGEFCLHYQPIIALHTHQIEGFEALLRWQHPQKGLLTPDQFIPLAEETGLILPIGAWVIQESCRQLQVWQKQYREPLTMSVNLSCKQLAQVDLVDLVLDSLRQAGLSCQSLKLELTESVMIVDAPQTIELLARLHELGIHLCIDDFGTGYSCLSYLQYCPTKGLKVDRCFVRQLDNPVSLEILRSTLTMAHNLGLSVVAEGIETHSQLSQLQLLQCDYGQGYWFSQPLPADQATDWLGQDSVALRC